MWTEAAFRGRASPAEDKFKFEFSGSMFSIEALIKIPNGPSMPLPMPAQGFAFYIAHKKDRGTGAGAGTTVTSKISSEEFIR